MQRWAAMELDISPFRVKDVSSSDRNGRSSSGKKIHVLLPSSFVLEDFNALEWIMITRHEQKKKNVLSSWRSTGRFRSASSSGVDLQIPRTSYVFFFLRNNSYVFEKSVVQGHKAHNDV
jgi:hypothetical protein